MPRWGLGPKVAALVAAAAGAGGSVVAVCHAVSVAVGRAICQLGLGPACRHHHTTARRSAPRQPPCPCCARLLPGNLLWSCLLTIRLKRRWAEAGSGNSRGVQGGGGQQGGFHDRHVLIGAVSRGV